MGTKNELHIRKTLCGLIAYLDEYKWIELRTVKRKGTNVIVVEVPEGWIAQRAFRGSCAPFIVLELTKALIEWAVKENQPIQLSIHIDDSWQFSQRLQYLLRKLVIWRQ